MRTAASLVVAALVVVSSPEARADEPCAFDGSFSLEPPADQPCDAPDIEMEHVCHCRGGEARDARPWGSTAGLSLQMPHSARVAGGETATFPFTLVYKGDKPITLDFPGGAVVFVDEVLRGGKPAPSAACGELRAGPPTVRLTLHPGSRIHGTLSWRASTSQLASCRDMARDLPAGRYTLQLATVSGEPALKATVDVTVETPHRKR